MATTVLQFFSDKQLRGVISCTHLVCLISDVVDSSAATVCLPAETHIAVQTASAEDATFSSPSQLPLKQFEVGQK